MCGIVRANLLKIQEAIMCDKEVLKCQATTMPTIILQRAEEVFPALRENGSCTVSLPALHRSCSETSITCIDGYDVVSVKQEEDSDIDCQEEETPVAISFATIKSEQDESIDTVNVETDVSIHNEEDVDMEIDAVCVPQACALEEKIDTVTVEGVENVGEEDCTKIKTEEEFCLELVRTVKMEQENSVDLWETVPSVCSETGLTVSADGSENNMDLLNIELGPSTREGQEVIGIDAEAMDQETIPATETEPNGLTLAPALQSLIDRKSEDAAHILEYEFHIHGGLRKLILERWSLGEGSTDLLTNIVDSYPDLEVLSLAGCKEITADGYCLIHRLNNLSELKLTGLKGVRGKTVRLIADKCQHLKKLSLRGVSLRDGDVIHVIDKLGNQLTTLDLYGPYLTDAAYSYLNKCPRLQELWVTFCKNMTDRGFEEGIGSLQELTHLCVTLGKKLTRQTWSTFLHRQSMSSIVFLDLTECDNLDDEGLQGIAERCIHLEELRVIGPCNVTDAGVSMVIRQCNQLRKLDVRDLKRIKGEGWLALIPSLLPHLRRLCLDGCRNVRDEYIEKLRAYLPQLEIIDPYGKIVRN